MNEQLIEGMKSDLTEVCGLLDSIVKTLCEKADADRFDHDDKLIETALLRAGYITESCLRALGDPGVCDLDRWVEIPQSTRDAARTRAPQSAG